MFIELGERRVPDRDRVPRRGLEAVDQYILRLFSATAELASVHIGSLNGERGFVVSRKTERVYLIFTVMSKAEAALEARVRQYFQENGGLLVEDYVASDGTGVDSIRILSYEFESSPEMAARLCKSSLRELCDIDESDGLTFWFHTIDDEPEYPAGVAGP